MVAEPAADPRIERAGQPEIRALEGRTARVGEAEHAAELRPLERPVGGVERGQARRLGAEPHCSNQPRLDQEPDLTPHPLLPSSWSCPRPVGSSAAHIPGAPRAVPEAAYGPDRVSEA